ncbi:MAG: RecX family transcriptional regulator [Eubacterium sp.]|nr:RecX family transcriptional regulator [Eubacterium sp.]
MNRSNEKKRPDIDECAAKKLSHKEMSAKELRDYLLKKEYEQEEVDRVIKTMLDFGYLNDARYAAEFLIYDLGRGRSLKKAFYDLRQKGVSEEDIRAGYDEYLDEFGEPDEHKAAYEEAVKVLMAADLTPGNIPDDMRDKINGRIARRLFTRGYSQSLIYDILAEIRR